VTRIQLPMLFSLLLVISTAPQQQLTAAAAENRDYFSIDVAKLVRSFDKSQIVSDPEILPVNFYQMETTPRVVVPSGNEAYIFAPEQKTEDYVGYRIIGSKAAGTAVDGQLYLIRPHLDQPQQWSLVKFDFHVDANPEAPVESAEFYRAKGRYFQLFWSGDYAGSAMFRHLAIDSLKKVGESASPIGPSWPLRRNNDVDGTIQLLSGGRAVSENLQLNRQLDDADGTKQELTDLMNVQGITIREIDWQQRLSSQRTEFDPLATLIPHDQYAVFVPSFQQLAAIIDRGSELARPIVQWFEPQSQTTDVLGFYQQQLGLPLDALTRQVGKALIDEVAVTGSDPYFRTGTDVAVLMRTQQPTVLHQAILAQVTAQATQQPDVKRIDHKVGEHMIAQWSNPRRDFCSLVTVVDDTVVVSNSIAQMMAIVQTSSDASKAMAALDEYKFFRQRYQRGSQAESAFVVVTDAAIRRWCGPQWRISASRRTRARASIAEMSMQHADGLVRGTIQGETQIQTINSVHDAGRLSLTSAGVRSDVYGTLDFQTPIAELDIRTATASEVELYVRWRERYENRWRNTFDPIALQVSLKEDAFALDLSVIPLILGTEYANWQSFIGNVRLKPGAGDRHDEELLSLVTAVDLNSPLLQFASMFLGNNQADVNLLSWVDHAAHVYFDHDEAWIKHVAARSPWQLTMENSLRGLPIGLYVPSNDSLKQALFVSAVRAQIANAAPNLVRWETVKHNEIDFVKGTAMGSTPVGQPEDLPHVYYVTLPDGFTFSLNENVIRRAIDRHLKRQSQPAEAADKVAEEVGAADPATGPQIATRVTGAGMNLLSQGNYYAGLNRMHRLTWGNIPILNYLRHQYPDRDPMQVYRQLFGQTLLEPGGGQYVWNDKVGTYVSTLQGHHLDPKVGPALGLALKPTDVVETTLSFQDSGLRATLNLHP
jgi:hypothetical protein